MTQATEMNDGEAALEPLVQALRVRFPGYHIDVSLYPNGGCITALGCAECGTPEVSWWDASWQHGLGGSIDTAISKLEAVLKAACDGEEPHGRGGALSGQAGGQ